MESDALKSTQLSPRPLFGGAISVCIPSQWRDVSEIRQVPDNQEVFQDCTFADGSAFQGELGIHGSGGCIVIEILEREDDVSDDCAAEFYFKDLAEANGRMDDSNSEDNTGSDHSIDYLASWSVGNDPNNIDVDEENKDAKGPNIMPQLSVKTKSFTCIGHQSVSPLRNRTTLEEGKSNFIKVELCVLRLEQVHTDLLISLSLPTSHDKYTSRKENAHEPLFLEVLRSFQVLDWSLFG